jgi:hypothetical protein
VHAVGSFTALKSRLGTALAAGVLDDVLLEGDPIACDAAADPAPELVFVHPAATATTTMREATFMPHLTCCL